MVRQRAECQQCLETSKSVVGTALLLRIRTTTTTTTKEGKGAKKMLVRTWWLSAKHLFLFAGLCCRTLLSGRHIGAAVCIVLFCAGPISGCSAVLAVRRKCVAIGAWFVPPLRGVCRRSRLKKKKNRKNRKKTTVQFRDRSKNNMFIVGK